MKRLAVLFALLFAASGLLVACGGGDDESEPSAQLTAETFAAALDDACSENNVIFDDLGTRGLNNPGVALEFEGTANAREAFIAAFEKLDADEEAQAQIDSYVVVTEKLAESDRAIAEAAADDDQKALSAAFSAQTPIYAVRDKLAEELGLEVCGKVNEIEVVDTGTGPTDEVTFAEPKNTIEEAADAYLKAALDGDCDAFNEQRHVDAGEASPAVCESVSRALEGGSVAGTEQYGPVGTAEIVGADEIRYPTYFVEDVDGKLRYGGDAIHDSGGLRPAPEGNDADETAEAMLAAIRSGSAEDFNATVSDLENSAFKVNGDDFDTIGQGKFGPAFIADLKADGAEMQPLGINSTYAFYLVQGSDNDWVVTLIHIPGDQNAYRLAGFYPIPKAK